MNNQVKQFAYTVELQPGEKLILPPELSTSVGPGRWLVTVDVCPAPAGITRRHDAFLHSYAPQDEGLYDDLAR